MFRYRFDRFQLTYFVCFIVSRIGDFYWIIPRIVVSFIFRIFIDTQFFQLIQQCDRIK